MASAGETRLLVEIGRRIRDRRRRKGLSQESVASLARVRPGTLSRVETGKAEPGIHVLKRLADALACTVGDLVDAARTEAPTEEELLNRWRPLDTRTKRVVLDLLERLGGM